MSAATIYTDRTSFEPALGSYLTDGYSPADGYPGGFGLYGNAVMSAYFGETAYTTTGWLNHNIIQGGSTYCAGCNGSFELGFTATSVGSPAGCDRPTS